MITPIHTAFDIAIYFSINHFYSGNINSTDLVLLLATELIDLDHIATRPVYHPKRNPFITHFLHKKWKLLLVLSIALLFLRPLLFLGIGILSHLFVDLVYVKLYRIEK